MKFSNIIQNKLLNLILKTKLNLIKDKCNYNNQNFFNDHNQIILKYKYME